MLPIRRVRRGAATIVSTPIRGFVTSKSATFQNHVTCLSQEHHWLRFDIFVTIPRCPPSLIPEPQSRGARLRGCEPVIRGNKGSGRLGRMRGSESVPEKHGCSDFVQVSE